MQEPQVSPFGPRPGYPACPRLRAIVWAYSRADAGNFIRSSATFQFLSERGDHGAVKLSAGSRPRTTQAMIATIIARCVLLRLGWLGNGVEKGGEHQFSIAPACAHSVIQAKERLHIASGPAFDERRV